MIEVIKNKLLEVQTDVVAINPVDRNSMSIFHKHDLVLTGDNSNRIYAIELLFMLDISVEKYIDKLPNICDELGFKYFDKITSNELFKDDMRIRSFTIELIP